MGQELEPTGPPLELAQHRIEITLGARRNVERDDSVEVAVGQNRIGDVVAIAARRSTVVAGLALEHDPPALGERLLGGLTEVCRRSTPFGPGRGGSEPGARGRRRKDDADPDAGNHAALDREPASIEGLRAGGLGEVSPDGGVRRRLCGIYDASRLGIGGHAHSHSTRGGVDTAKEVDEI